MTEVVKGGHPQQRVDPRAKVQKPQTHEEMTHEPPRTRTRQRMLSAAPPTHDNYVNMDNVPDDVSLNWKRFSVTGQEMPYYLEQMRKQGWEPVNPQEHPTWVNLPPGYDATTVIVEGQILMERPTYLTEEAFEDNKLAAKQRMDEAKQRLGQKTTDQEADRTKPKIVEEMGRMVGAPQAIED